MKTTTEMQLVPIEKLVPYANNARTHTPEQINKLRSSLREFGFVNPVIIDRDFGVIAGHGRILAAKEENIDEIPCVFADHLTEAQKKAYIIADNRMAMDAGWDEELLRVEIEALQEMDFDPMLTGFDEAELADLFAADDAEVQDDDFDLSAALEKAAFVQRGDIWTVGRHRLMCGDKRRGCGCSDGRQDRKSDPDGPAVWSIVSKRIGSDHKERQHQRNGVLSVPAGCVYKYEGPSGKGRRGILLSRRH